MSVPCETCSWRPHAHVPVALVLAALSLPLPALATCVCRCVDGEMVPICTSSIDLPPICPPTICPLVPPSIQPIQPPVVPPIGTTRCEQKQVWSEASSATSGGKSASEAVVCATDDHPL